MITLIRKELKTCEQLSADTGVNLHYLFSSFIYMAVRKVQLCENVHVVLGIRVEIMQGTKICNTFCKDMVIPDFIVYTEPYNKTFFSD